MLALNLLWVIFNSAKTHCFKGYFRVKVSALNSENAVVGVLADLVSGGWPHRDFLFSSPPQELFFVSPPRGFERRTRKSNAKRVMFSGRRVTPQPLTKILPAKTPSERRSKKERTVKKKAVDRTSINDIFN